VGRYAPDWAKAAWRQRSAPAKVAAKVDRPEPPPTLARLARQADWKLDKASSTFLKSLETRLARRRHDNVAILADDGWAWAELFVTRWPKTRVLLLGAQTTAAGSEAVDTSRAHDRIAWTQAASASDFHAALTAHGPFDAILDVTSTTTQKQLERFKATFFHLLAGGVYVVRSFQDSHRTGEAAEAAEAASQRESVWQFVARVADYQARGVDRVTPQHRDDASYARAIETVIKEPELLLITNTMTAMPKLRDYEVDRVLAARTAEPMGTVVDVRPGLTFPSRCTLTVNEPKWNFRFTDVYTVPSVSLRAYDEVLCCPHQVVIKDGILLPDSYRHNTHPRLANRFTTEVSQLFAQYPKDIARPKQLRGDYFYLDSEWPHHFGHVMTEQLSRLWAWPAAKRAYPDLKALVPLPGGHNELAPFEVAVFTAAGIDPEDLVTSKGVVQVERLLSATPMLVNPDYIHPDIVEVWRTVGDALISSAPVREYPRTFFSSRRPTYKRACHNVEEVEAFFAGHGFPVVYPEDYSPAEQAAMFNQAETIAGFAGSALFSLNFCEQPKHVIMISSESYTARNEYMISSVLGHRVDLFWCDADLKQPEKGWDGTAFASGFTFDFDRDGDRLAEAIGSA
jgi:capsular polysaccharide biosynthesis protein